MRMVRTALVLLLALLLAGCAATDPFAQDGSASTSPQVTASSEPSASSDSSASPALPSTSTEEQEEPIHAGELIDEALLAPSSDEDCLVDTEFDFEEEYEDGRDTVEGAAALNLDLARPSIEEFGSISEERRTVVQSNTLRGAKDVVSVLAGGRVINPGASRRVVVGPKDTDARPARAVFEDLGRGWVITQLVVFGENDGCDGLYGEG